MPATIEINASYPVAQGTTLENLKTATGGENEEWSELYPEFAKIAEEEGFAEIATAFNMIASAEKWHEKRFQKLAENIANNKVFSKDNEILWKCGNYGYVHKGISAPDICPACVHPQSYFEVFVEPY